MRNFLYRLGYCATAILFWLPFDSRADDAASAAREAAYARTWSEAEIEAERSLKREWLGNEIGISDTVPPPWVPLEVDGQSVVTFGQIYQYADTLFPAQVWAAGESLFAAAPYVRIRSGGNSYELRSADVSIKRISDAEVQVTTVAREGPLLLTLDTLYEFDGMARVGFELQAAGGRNVQIDDVRLVFEYQGERAVLYHIMSAFSNKPPRFSDGGFLPDSGFEFDQFRELIWLGDHYRGFCWFAESMENWQIKDEEEIQTVRQSGPNSVELTVKLADKRFTLNRPWQLVFGFQATPTREIIDERREKSDRNKRTLWAWDWGDGGTYYPFFTNPGPPREFIQNMRAQGREVMPSSSQRFYSRYRNHHIRRFGEIENPGLIHREVLLWESEWRQRLTPQIGEMPERHTAPGDWYGTFGPGGLTNLCAASPFQDYYLWRLKQSIEDTDLGAIYLDQPMGICANEHHGCGYVNYAGEWTPNAPIFARREFQKRMYRLFHEAHGQTRIMWHSSNQIIVPVISFTDIFLDGEEYSPTRISNPISYAYGMREFYSDILPVGRMQAHHTGLQFGFAPSLLTKFNTTRAPSAASVSDVMGYFLVHDSHVRPIWSAYNHFGAYINDIWFEFPFADSRQYYYWEEHDGIGVESPDGFYILHAADDDQLMLILHNPLHAPMDFNISLDADALGLRGSVLEALEDAESGQVFVPLDGHFEIPIAPKDLRILIPVKS